MIDVWSSAGVGLPKQMPALEHIPLPCDEEIFLSLEPGDSALQSRASSASSLLAQMITLNRILVEINEVNQRTVAGNAGGVVLENTIMELSKKLDDWHRGLPPFMHDNFANLQHYAAEGLGRIFVAVYLGYYHFGQLLFYQFLHSDCHDTVLNAEFYANKCKTYAESLCEIIYSARDIPGCEVQYTMVGHILVIASTVQIHTLLFSDNEDQISAARKRLEKNFEILSQLRIYWPTLDISFTRLRAFHQACRDSMDESFRLDQWMLRFLYQFAEPVSDKVVGQSPDWRVWSWDSIEFSPHN